MTEAGVSSTEGTESALPSFIPNLMLQSPKGHSSALQE